MTHGCVSSVCMGSYVRLGVMRILSQKTKPCPLVCIHLGKRKGIHMWEFYVRLFEPVQGSVCELGIQMMQRTEVRRGQDG